MLQSTEYRRTVVDEGLLKSKSRKPRILSSIRRWRMIMIGKKGCSEAGYWVNEKPSRCQMSQEFRPTK